LTFFWAEIKKIERAAFEVVTRAALVLGTPLLRWTLVGGAEVGQLHVDVHNKN